MRIRLFLAYAAIFIYSTLREPSLIFIVTKVATQ